MVGGGNHVAHDSLQRVIQVDATRRSSLEQQHHSLFAIAADTGDIEHVMDAIERRHQLAALNQLSGFRHHLQQAGTCRAHTNHGVAQAILDVRAERRAAAVGGVGTHLHLPDVLVDATLGHATDQGGDGAEEDLIERKQVVAAAIIQLVFDKAVSVVVGDESLLHIETLAAGTGQAKGVPVILDFPGGAGHQHGQTVDDIATGITAQSAEKSPLAMITAAGGFPGSTDQVAAFDLFDLAEGRV
ncbi:hypothetical protein D3C84_726880 [compost metagenome]